MIIRKLYLILITGLLISFLFSCSKKTNPPTGPGDSENLALLTVTPTSGAPGQTVTITGYHFDNARIDDYEVLFDDNQAPIRIINDSTTELGIPLFLDTAIGWSVPPTMPISIDVYLNDTLVAQSDKVVTIDSLPHAAGTTEQTMIIMDSVLTNFQLLFSQIPVTDTWEIELRDSLFAIIGQLVNGPDTSIAAILNGTSSMTSGFPVSMELTDALLNATGTLDYWREFLSAFSHSTEKLQRKIQEMRADFQLCDGTGDDMDLACKMQIYVLVRDYSHEYLGETRSDWENSIGLMADIASLYPPANGFPPVTVAKMISSILTITDIVIENVILSILPFEITGFDMVLQSDSLGVNEFTNSQIFISAVNSPDSLSINEMVDLVMSVMGLKNAPVHQEMTEIVLNMIKFIVDKLRAFYSYLAFMAPDIFNPDQVNDGTWYGFPTIPWRNIEVTHYELVRLYSENPDIMQPDSLVFEWWSANCGVTIIDARTRAAGATATVVNAGILCYPCEYSGGAFGEEIVNTTAHHMKVGQSGNMEINISGLPAGDTADVLVIYPDGTTFEHFAQSGVMNDLESGSYQIQAHERTGSDGAAYVVDPESRTVEITCDSTIVVNLEYTRKFGSLYIAFAGLNHGTEGEVPGDVRIEGPNDFVREISFATLIDSLEPGIYDLFAFEVSDNWGQVYVPDSSYVELTVERANTTAFTVTYKEKYAILNINVAKLPSGAQADIDITGPDSYFKHITASEQLDSLLEGQYIVNAYDIVDPNSGDTIKPAPLTQTLDLVGGDEEYITIDYSGGNKLTVTFEGLPPGAQANMSISGPDGYFETVTSDTTLKGLLSGGPFNIVLDTTYYNGRKYYPKMTDTTIYVYSDITLSFEYETKAIMSVYLGGLRDTTNTDDEKGQMIIRAYSSTKNSDTTISDEKYDPQLGTLPQQLSLDTCGFEDGRLLLYGTTTYSVTSATSKANANIDITFDVNDSTAAITFDGYFKVLSPSVDNTTDNASARIEVVLQNLLRIEVMNPNESQGSSAAISSTGIFEILNPASSSAIRGSINWNSRRHKCNEPWSNVFYVFTSTYGNFRYILNSDTTQTIAGSMGGPSVSGGESGEEDMGLSFGLGDSSSPGQETREATIHGEIVIVLRQF